MFLSAIFSFVYLLTDLVCLPSFLCAAGLDRLIAKLDGEYLANFCSILAVTISDLDVYENKTLCKDWLIDL